MSLKIGKKITRYSWDEIPMPDTVIYRVKKLGESQPEYFIFTDSRGRQNVGVELIGLDGEITKALLQIQNVENHDLNQSDLVDEELAAQPDQENEEDLPLVPRQISPRNSKKARKQGDICLGTSGNQ